MGLQQAGFIDLPPHAGEGGFDHAAIHQGTGRLYIAHTANNAVDVIDCHKAQYLHSIPGLAGVAGALVSEERGLIFTSNRGENTVGILKTTGDQNVAKIPVGVRPNGLSFDPGRNLLLAANVGDPAIPDSYTLTMIDTHKQKIVAEIPVPGRTRWTIFDRKTDSFYVNIADPPLIVAVNAGQPTVIARQFPIPAAGPHGLDLDPASDRLFCACDAKKLFCVDTHTGHVTGEADLSGAPDVIFFDAALHQLYVAIGDPGAIDVFDTTLMKRVEVVATEQGAHTIALDAQQHNVYAFLPKSHRAAKYRVQKDMNTR